MMLRISYLYREAFPSIKEKGDGTLFSLCVAYFNFGKEAHLFCHLHKLIQRMKTKLDVNCYKPTFQLSFCTSR
jgi:hypothetical protein